MATDTSSLYLYQTVKEAQLNLRYFGSMPSVDEIRMLAVLDEFSRQSRSLSRADPLDWPAFISLVQSGQRPLLDLKSSRTQWLPIHFTSHFTSPQYCERLLTLGADANATEDLLGRTPLHLCVIQGRFEPEAAFATARVLLQLGKADPNAEYCSGTTPLFDAVSSDNIALVQLLVDYGADVNALVSSDEPAVEGKKQARFSALFVAVYHGKIEAVRTLLNAGAKLDSDGSVPSLSEMLPFNQLAKDCLETLKIDPNTLQPCNEG